MKFSQFAGTSIVPTLSRLVLALAFVTAGYNKLMRDVEFNSADAETLRTLDVSLVKVTENPAGDATAAAGGPRILLASLQETPDEAPEEAPEEAAGEPAAGEGGDEPPAESDVEAPDEATGETPAGADEDAGEAATDTPVVAPLPDDGSRYTARGLHRVTLMCHKNQWPAPKIMGYAAGITELLGGGLILIGFLTRIWALGLSITMGVAFYFVSIGINGVHTVSPFDFALDTGSYLAAIAQLALFVLSFGLVMTGAGAISLDRMLFGRRGGGGKKAAVEVDYDDMDNVPGRASRPM